MAYIINGPVTIGDNARDSTINGNVILANTTTAPGDIVYAGPSANILANLPIGSTGQVLTVVSGAPAWTFSGEASTYGFLGLMTATQTVVSGSPVVLTGWTTSGDPAYDTTAGDFNSTTGVFTVSASGHYQLNVEVSFLGSSNAGTRTLDLFNGTTAVLVRTIQPTGDNSITNVISICANMNLTATATYSVRLTTSNGTMTVQSTPQTFFGISRLSLD